MESSLTCFVIREREGWRKDWVRKRKGREEAKMRGHALLGEK